MKSILKVAWYINAHKIPKRQESRKTKRYAIW
jgi:hypothetical protein